MCGGERAKKMERGRTVGGKGTTDEDRVRCVKAKDKKGRGSALETESGSLPF